MSVKLPNGIILALATAYDAAKTITAITNANPAAVSSVANGYADGDIIEVTSGWNGINGILARVADATTDAYDLEGQNTTDTSKYPAGTGVGSTRKISAFTQLSQVTGLSFNGGEMQYANYSFLEEDFEREIPTQASPITLSADIADDPSLAGYIALAAAAETRALTGLKMTFPSGSLFLFNCIVSMVPIPKLNKGEIMTVTANFSLQGKPVRYAS